MIKARIWIVDADENDNFDKVYGNFDMKPSEEWTTGTLFGDVKNYKFSFTMSTIDKEASNVVIKTQ